VAVIEVEPIGRDVRSWEAKLPTRPVVSMSRASQPGPASTGCASHNADPCQIIRDASVERPFVVAQLGQSLDGRVATPTGESRWINREAALDHLHRLRACVDAVVVGVGTVLADDPMLNVRRVPGRHPARVVIDPAGRLPHGPRCLTDDGVQRIVVRACETPTPPGVDVIRLPRVGDLINPAEIVAALFERGLKRLLIEGGARTVSRFIDAGAVDRLHVLVAPMIIGSGQTGLDLAAITSLAQARRPKTHVHLLEDGDVLFDCDLRSDDGRPA
jgi:diaminohydroxyphosphoribosylaminopyrimidine deaminase/5-amino-6-(5-phosphoribosylamino)uracil reductase